MKTEIWKDIPGYKGLYEISSCGRIRSLRSGKLRKDVQSGKGYRAIQLSDSHHKKKRFYVHRLVAFAFLGSPTNSSDVVNHKNLNKSDNRLENLEWATSAENMHHAYIHGRTDFRRPIRRDNTSGIKGVSRQTSGYQVSLCGKYVGWYPTLEQAHVARRIAERRALENAKIEY